MKRKLGVAFLAMFAMCATAPVHAQQPGPPIPPDQILRQQNQPVAPVPSPPVPATPPSATSPRSTAPLPVPGGSAADRAARCQHQATVERVPQSRRAAYIHNCIMN